MTTTINSITRARAQQIIDATTDALKAVETKFGLTITKGRYKFSSNSLSIPIEFSLGAEAQAVQDDANQRMWDRNCVRWGLKPEHFGKEISLFGDGEYKIIGCSPTRPKNCITISQVRGRLRNAKIGKQYVCPPEQILRALENADR